MVSITKFLRPSTRAKIESKPSITKVISQRDKSQTPAGGSISGGTIRKRRSSRGGGGGSPTTDLPVSSLDNVTAAAIAPSSVTSTLPKGNIIDIAAQRQQQLAALESKRSEVRTIQTQAGPVTQVLGEVEPGTLPEPKFGIGRELQQRTIAQKFEAAKPQARQLRDRIVPKPLQGTIGRSAGVVIGAAKGIDAGVEKGFTFTEQKLGLEAKGFKLEDPIILLSDVASQRVPGVEQTAIVPAIGATAAGTIRTFRQPVRNLAPAFLVGGAFGAGLRGVAAIPKVGKPLAAIVGFGAGATFVGGEASRLTNLARTSTQTEFGTIVTQKGIEFAAFGKGAKLGAKGVSALVEPVKITQATRPVKRVAELRIETAPTPQGQKGQFAKVLAQAEVKPPVQTITTTRARQFFNLRPLSTSIKPAQTATFTTLEPVRVDVPFKGLRTKGAGRVFEVIQIGKQFSKVISTDVGTKQISLGAARNLGRVNPRTGKITPLKRNVDFSIGAIKVKPGTQGEVFAGLTRSVKPLPTPRGKKIRLVEGVRKRGGAITAVIGEVVSPGIPKSTTTFGGGTRPRPTQVTDGVLKQSTLQNIVKATTAALKPTQVRTTTRAPRPTNVITAPVRTLRPTSTTRQRQNITTLSLTTQAVSPRQRIDTQARTKTLTEAATITRSDTRSAQKSNTAQRNRQLQKQRSQQRQAQKQLTKQIQRRPGIPILRFGRTRFRPIKPIEVPSRPKIGLPEREVKVIPTPKKIKKKRFLDDIILAPDFTLRTLGIKATPVIR